MRNALGIVLLASVGWLWGCGSATIAPLPPDQDGGGGGDAAVDASSGEAGGDSGPVGHPSAQIPTADIDFGTSDCGGAPAGQKVLTFKNTGDGPLTWQAALDKQTYFFPIGASSGSIAPGQSATLTLSANAVAQTTAAGTQLDSTLTISTNDPAHAKTDIKVKVAAVGATFQIAPATAAFGTVPLNQQATDIPISIKNTGNKSVTLSFTQPQDTQFALTWQGAPADVTLAPGASVPGLAARFKPSVLLTTTTSAAVSVTGAVCGSSLTEIGMSGLGSSGVFSMQPASIDFGTTDCGKASALPAAQRTITIGNGGNLAFTFNASLGSANSPYTVQVQGSPIAPGGTGTVVVTPKAIPGAASVADNAFGDTLTITTNINGDTPHAVDLRQTASGAILQFQPATPIAFGSVPINTTASSGYSVANVGNAAATVTAQVTNTPIYSLNNGALGALAPGDTAQDTLTFAPTTATLQKGTISLSVGAGDVLCAPLPTLSASGTGTNGVVNVSPSTLDFGLVDCGTRAGAKTITVSNGGNGAFNVTALTLTNGGSYNVTPPVPFAVPAGQSVNVTVTPIQIPNVSDVTPDLYADALTISTDAIGDTNHVIELHMTARGAILVASTDTVAFGGQPINTSTAQQLSVSNNGNVPVIVSYTNTNTVFSFSPQGASIPAGGGEVVIAAFKPLTTTQYSDTANFKITGGTALCGPLPTPLALSGTGTNGAVAISPSTIDIGLVPCGTQAQRQTIAIQNTGTAAFNWTATLTAGGNYYVLSQTAGSVDPGTTFNLDVSPSPIPATSLTTADLYAGTITITTDIAGDSPHQVLLHETAQGARLSVNVTQLAFGSVVVGSTKNLGFEITNGGNATANVAYAGFQSPPFDATPGGVPILGGAKLSVTASFSPQTTGAVTGQSLSVTTPDLLCSPLPAAIPLSGTGQ